MSLFQYKAFTSQGKKISATLEANSFQEAKEKVRDLGLILVDLRAYKGKKASGKMKEAELIVFTTQLHQLLSAKIPLYESLLALEEQSRQEPYHPVVLGLAERIKTGKSLSQAMQEFPKTFSPLYRGLISSGEAVGNLETSLSRLSTFLERQNRIKKQVISAAIYPAMLAALMVIAVGILVFFVIPALEVLFDDRPIPSFTFVVLSISHFIRDFWYILLLFIGGLVGSVMYHSKKPKNKDRLHAFFLKVPFISKYLVISSLAKFSRTLSTLLEGGVPIASAITFAEGSLQNIHLKNIIREVSTKMIEGVPLSSQMAKYRELPPIFVRMVHIGEESGSLAAMLSHVATLYEDEIERAITRAISLMQPTLLLIMGLIIGTVLLAILLPISDFGANLGP